jgi:chemotaxis protein MotA
LGILILKVFAVDIATLLGLLGGTLVIITTMELGGGLSIYFDLPAIILVVMGSNMVVVTKFGMSQILSAFKIAAKAFFVKIDDPEELIETSLDLAQAARKGGLLSLENKKINNDFLKKGIQYLVDGHEPEVVRNMLTKDMQLTIQRHEVGQKIFKALGDIAPGMGMIGTLMGLVGMLINMTDPKSIGPAMAIGLLTTFYGAVIANMIALPISEKLALRSEEEYLSKSLIIDALTGILNGQNPRLIKEMLNTYLPLSRRNSDYG